MPDTDTTTLGVHSLTMQLGSHELARRLNTHLGATLVATLANVKDRKLPYKWATADGPAPKTESLQRLQIAYRAWVTISSAENDYVARSWFIGMNPRLGEESPVMAIREGRLTEVTAAAKAFTEGIDE